MQAPLEKELKYALSARSHALLVAALHRPGVKVARQYNVYFDDEVLALRRQRFGLRIRIVDDARAILAVKYPPPAAEDSSRGAFKVRQELEAPMDLALARKVIAGDKPIGELDSPPLAKIREVFARSTVDSLHVIGDLHTERTIVPWEDGLDLELDACRTLDRVFFELEVETDDPKTTDRRIRKLLAQHDISCRPLRRSKLARVFTTIREQQKHLENNKPRKKK